MLTALGTSPSKNTPATLASRPAATAAHAQQGAYSLQASAAVVAASSGILLSVCVCVPLRIAKISNSDVYLRPTLVFRQVGCVIIVLINK